MEASAGSQIKEKDYQLKVPSGDGPYVRAKYAQVNSFQKYNI